MWIYIFCLKKTHTCTQTKYKKKKRNERNKKKEKNIRNQRRKGENVAIVNSIYEKSNKICL